MHPLVEDARATGKAASCPSRRPDATARTNRFIHVEVDRESDPARLKALGDGLLAVLADVRAAVRGLDADARGDARRSSSELAKPPKGLDAAEVEETRAFLSWALDENFTFIGYREYELARAGGEDQLKIVPRSGLGVLREPPPGRRVAELPRTAAAIRALAREPRLLVLTKANSRATVHRPGYLDYVGVKKFDAAGRVTGERRFVGLYTTAAYHADPRDIPLLRRKVARVLDRAGLPGREPRLQEPACRCCRPTRATSSSRSTSPRSSRSRWACCAWATGASTRVFLRRDLYGRFFSCLVYLPRENFNTDVRLKIQEILKRRLSRDERGIHGAAHRRRARAHPHPRAHAARRTSRSVRRAGDRGRDRAGRRGAGRTT